MRIQRVVLEHHGNVARHRRHLGHVPSCDQNLAFRGFLKARDHAQGGALAATRLTQQHHELAFGHGQIEMVDHRNVAETLDDVSQFKAVGV